MSVLQAIEEKWLRFQVGPKVRKNIYTIISRQMENDAQLSTTLDTLYAMYSKDGRKPTRAPAMMIADIQFEVAEGHGFAPGLRRWVDPEEATLIAAGESSGNLSRAFNDALYLIEQRNGIKGAVWGGVFSSAPMIIALIVMLQIITKKVIPAFAHVIPAETWEGAARPMYLLSYFVQHFGILTLILIAVLIAAISASMSRLTGNVRYYLDKVAPWSVNRRIKGSMFLLNVAVLIGSNVKLKDAIELLHSRSNNYVRERLDATLHGLRKGTSFGKSLVDADFDWPDRNTNRLLTMLDSLDNFDVALRNFAHDDLKDLREMVQRSMVMTFYFFLIVIALLNVMIILGNVWLQTRMGTHG